MRENYYALLICIIRPDYNIDRSLQAMIDGEITKTRNTAVKKDDVEDMIRMKQQGMTYKAIGELYGMKKDAVHKRIQRYKEAVAV